MIRFPKTHDLAEILSIIEGQGLLLPPNPRAVADLTKFAVESRYPGVAETVSEEHWQSAVRVASAVVAWCEGQLQLPP